MIDYPGYEHRFGALERDNTFVHLFKGFMSAWGVYDQFKGGFTTEYVSFDGTTCTNGIPCFDGQFDGSTVLDFSECDALKYVDD